jgi:hypothetical protein
LAHQSYDQSYTPPLTVTLSVPCARGCNDMSKSEPTLICGYCCETVIASEMVPPGTCCTSADGFPFCLGCLKKYVTTRPTHRMNWSIYNPMQHKVVRVGVKLDQTWFQCTLCRQSWKNDGTLDDYVPFGFYRDHPVADKDVFYQLLQHHATDIQNQRLRSVEERIVLIDELTFLGIRAGLDRYVVRVNKLVEEGTRLYSLADAMEFLNKEKLIETDQAEPGLSNRELIKILTDGRSKLPVKAAEEYLKANSLWI